MAKSVPQRSYYVWGGLRIGLGAIFLWAFLDKLFGLGFATCRDAETDTVSVMCDSAWLEGGSPTSGFLNFATKGPFEDIFQNMAGNAFVDWLFMLGLLGIGVGLLFGVAVKISAVSGIVMLMLMWLAVLPPEHHPVLDDHIIYSGVLIGILLTNSQQKWGLRKWWVNQEAVKRYSILE